MSSTTTSGLGVGDVLDRNGHYAEQLQTHWTAGATDPETRALLLCQRARDVERTAGDPSVCRSGHHREALTCWLEALELAPEIDEARRGVLRYVSSAMLTPEERLRAFDQLDEVATRDERIQLRLDEAAWAIDRNDLRRARESLEEAHELAPSDRRVLDALADLAEMTADAAGAADWHAARADATSDTRFEAALGLTIARSRAFVVGDHAGATRRLRNALAAAPEARSLYRATAQNHMIAGEWRAVAQTLEHQAETTEQSTAEYQCLLAEATRIHLRRLGSFAYAQRLLDRALDAGESPVLLELVREVALEGGGGDVRAACERLAAAARNPTEHARYLWLTSEELGDGPRALELLEQAVEVDPDYITATLALELAYYQPDATPRLIEALARRGRAERLPGLVVQAGRIAWESLGDAERAETLFRDALSNVTTTDALFGPLGAADALLDLLDAQGDAGEARKVVSWLLEQSIEPEQRLDLQNRLAQLCLRSGDQEAATRAFTRVLALDSHDAFATQRLAGLHYASASWDALYELRTTEREALELTDPERAEVVRWESAEILARKLGRVDDALGLLDQGLEQSPDFVPLRVSSARLLIEHGRDRALATLYRRELERADGDRARIALNLALLYEHALADIEGALRYYRVVLDARPAELAAMLGLLRVGQEAGDDDAVERALEGLGNHTEDPGLRAAFWFELGDRRSQRGELALACDAYARSLDDEPRSAAANIAWEAAAVRLGRLDAVESRLHSLIEIAPDSSEAIEWLERLLLVVPPEREEIAIDHLLARDPKHLQALVRRLMRTMRSGAVMEIAQATHSLSRALPPGTVRAALEQAAAIYADVVPDAPSFEPALWDVIELRHLDVGILVRLLAALREDADRQRYIRTQGALARGAMTEMTQASYLTGLARALADDGQYEGADHALEEVLRIQPDFIPAIRLMRILADDVGEQEKVAQALELRAGASRESSEAITLWLKAAHVRRRQVGDVDGAAHDLERVLEIDPRHERAFDDLHELYTSRRRFDELYDLLRQRAEALGDPEARIRMLLRAAELAYERIKDMDRAIAAHRRVIEIDPSFIRSYRVIAEICLERGDWKRALEAFDGVLTLADNEKLIGRTWHKVGTVLDEHLDEPERAIGAFRKALEALPEHLDSLYRLADIYERLERWSETVTVLEVLGKLERVPLERKAVLMRLCSLRLRRFEDPDGAEAAVVAAREIDPSDLSLTRNLAEAYAKRGWKPRRRQFLEASFAEYRDRFVGNVSRTSPLHAMYAIAEWLKSHDRRFTLSALLSFVGAATDEQDAHYKEMLESTGHRLPRRPLPMEKTSGIFAPGLHASVLHVMRHTNPHIGRFNPTQMHLRSVSRRHRVNPSSREELGMLAPFAGALGQELPQIYLVPDRGEVVKFVAGDEPAIIIDQRDLEQVLLPETMVRVAIGCASLAMGLGNYASLDLATFERVLLGVCTAVLPERQLGRPDQQAMLQSVARAIPKRVAEGLAGYVLEILDRLEPAHIARQHQAVIATSMRLGLLTMFDPRPGLTVIARDGDAGRFDVVDVMKDALVFLVSDRYAALRSESGIALGSAG